jgi:hypothetical protein
VHLDARHAEAMRVEQRLARAAQRRKQLFLGILEPAQEVREPHDAGGVGIGPMDLLANLKETHDV